MTTTHLLPAISANTFDLSDYIKSVSILDMQAHLARSLVNNSDFIIKSAVFAAYKYLKAENIVSTTNTTFHEIVDAINELQLAELAFFEAGNNNASIIDTVQHLHSLREEYIDHAREISGLVDGQRSVASDLWAQANDRRYEPMSIEEQLENPVFKTSRSTQQKIKISIARSAKDFNLTAEDVDTKIKARLAAVENRNLESQEGLASFAPIYIALFEQMMRTNVYAMRETETRGSGHSTEGNPSRQVHVAERTFVTLPYKVKAVLISKAIQDTNMFRSWKEEDRRISVDEFTFIDLTADKVERDLKSVLNSPAFTQASRAEANV